MAHYLTKPDLTKLFRSFHAAGNQTHQMVALTLLFTGARISQVLALKGSDIFEWDGRAVVKVGSAKRGEDGLHAIHAEPDPAFDMTPMVAMAQRSGPNRLFGGLDRFYFDRILKLRGQEAGIHHSFLHAHMFRHSAAILVYDGAQQRPGAVKKFMQHRAMSSTMIYLEENEGRIAQAAMDAVQLSTV